MAIKYKYKLKKIFSPVKKETGDINFTCKEIEENNRMGNIRDLFKKIRDIKGTSHAKMGLIKD